MGYDTDFYGSFKTDKPVDEKTFKLINGLASTRRMKRNISGYGVDGEFYYNEYSNDFGQEHEDNIIDYNTPPKTQPSLWLKWKMLEDRQTIEWDGGGQFYAYEEWIKYIIKNILEPKGYVLNGEVEYYGEERTDYGTIIVENNKVSCS